MRHMVKERAFEMAESTGFSHWGCLDASDLLVREEVRGMCAADKCRMYDASWSCPPACGTTDEARRSIASYDWGLLVQTTGHTEDSFDYEAMQETEARHKAMLRDLCDGIGTGEDYLPLGSGACTLCDKCSYPSGPCRQPERMISSMEAYGLMVSDVCALAGVPYAYGENSITFTGCILFKQPV